MLEEEKSAIEAIESNSTNDLTALPDTASLAPRKKMRTHKEEDKEIEVKITSSFGIHVQCNWAFAFFRDNIHSFLQLLTLAGYVGRNIEAAKFGDCLLKSTIKG